MPRNATVGRLFIGSQEMVSVYSMYNIFFDLKGLFIRVTSSSICSCVPVRFVSPIPAWKMNKQNTEKIDIAF